MASTYLSKLTLTNFRNYRQATVSAQAKPIVLTGHNGAGKTNILEAISLFSPGKGIRNATLSEIDCSLPEGGDNPFAGLPWSLYAQFSVEEENISIATGRDGNSTTDKRVIQVDRQPQKSQASLAKIVTILSLTPQMDQTFYDGSTSRRLYLDKLTTAFYPDHVRALAIYEHAKSERRKLLMKSTWDNAWLNTLERRMAEQGVAIAANRIEMLHLLRSGMDDQRIETTELFPRAIFSIRGEAEEALSQVSALEAEDRLVKAYASSRKTDAVTGRTHHGPHKSDFIVIHPEKNLTAEQCSTGEQKALLLSITMAAVRAKITWTEATPILLLDEVVAHLDPAKRDAFFDELMDLSVQSWLTGTEPELFSFLKGKAQFLTVENARIIG